MSTETNQMLKPQRQKIENQNALFPLVDAQQTVLGKGLFSF